MSIPAAIEGLRAVNELIRRRVYRSPAWTRLLFGVDATPYCNLSFWELPTLFLRQQLRYELRNGMRVLEVGTGPYATLALWAKRGWALNVVATDIDPDVVQAARECASRNDLKIRIHQSDIAKGIDGPFDLAWGVLPYTPRERYPYAFQPDNTAKWGISHLHEIRTIGGEQGWELTQRYYRQVARLLRPGGLSLVCFNLSYLDERHLISLATDAELEIHALRKAPGLPYSSHIMRRPS